MKLPIPPFVCLGLLLCQAGLAVGAERSSAGWEITADRLERDESADVVVASGKVVMVQQLPAAAAASARTIKADWVRYDRRQGLVQARGEAMIESPRERITAERAELDLNRDTGRLSAATLYFPEEHLYLEGREVEKSGEFTYHLVDGWASKCKPVPGQASPWSFAWAEGDLTVDGFARFQNATFRVKDLPVAYAPFMAIPTNRQRKSGFLLPELSSSKREGTGIIVPFFLNLSPAHDLTLHAGSYGARGAVAATEFRYRWAEYSQGAIAFAYLQDRTVDTLQEEYKSDGVLRGNESRYWLRGKVDHDFGNLLLGKVDLDLVSDRDYLQEFNFGELGYDESEQRFQRAFGRGFDNKTNPLRANVVQLSKFWRAMAINSEVRLLQDPTAPATTEPWTLPRLNFSGQTPVLGGEAGGGAGRGFFSEFEFSWEAEYLRYWRERGSGYQRGHLAPKVEAPIPLTPYLEVVASVGADQTWYELEGGAPALGDPRPSRTLGNLQLAASSTWVREFGLEFEEYKSLNHMIRPTLRYAAVSVKDQTELPRLDAVDRIGGGRRLTYGLDNDFDLFGEGGDGRLLTRKYANFKAFQSYELGRDDGMTVWGREGERPWSPLDLELSLNPFARYALNYKSLLGVHGEGVTRYEVNTDLTNGRHDHLALGYRYGREHEIDQLNAGVLLNLNSQVLLGGAIAHSLATDQTVEGNIRLLYSPACWNVELKLAVTPDDDYRATVVFSLEGIGKVFGLNQNFASPMPNIGG